MRKLPLKIITAAVAALFMAQEASAVPAFARQMNMECMACHTQNVPKLNKFGREFKMSGFTMTSGEGAQSLISGTDESGLSLPSVLNLSFITKARYHSSSKEKQNSAGDAIGSNRGNLEIFDESALWFGGRVADNVGVGVEFATGLMGGKFIFSNEGLGGRYGAAYYTTDALGAFAGMETYTTGLYRPVRQFENRKATNAAQKTGVGDGAATGVQAFYANNSLYATFGMYGPAQNGNPGLDVGTDLNSLYRLAYEIPAGDWNIMVGVYGLGGKTILSEDATEAGASAGGDLIGIAKTTTGFDVQAEGRIADMSTMVTFNMVAGNKTEVSNESNASVAATITENSATSLEFQINPSDKVGVKAAYLTYADKENDANDLSAMSVGLEYNHRQNVRFVVEYTTTDMTDASKDDFTDIYLMAMIAF